MKDFRIYRLRGNVPTVGFFKNPLGITSKSNKKFQGHKPYYAIYKPCTTETWLELNRGDGDFDGYRIIGFCVRVNRIEFFYSF